MSNLLIVTAPESDLPRLQAIAAYLDDKRWYQPRPLGTPEPPPPSSSPATE